MEKKFKVTPLSQKTSTIEGLEIINSKTVTDNRGTVRELYRKSSYDEMGVKPKISWNQVNLTKTKLGAVRGLHGENMSKLVTVAFGSAFGVYVDTRLDSKTRGEVVTVVLKPGIQVFVPEGVCNGFQALEEETEYLYFFDNEWTSDMAGVSLSPTDPELAIEWPIAIDPNNIEQISEKDSKAPRFSELFENS